VWHNIALQLKSYFSNELDAGLRFQCQCQCKAHWNIYDFRLQCYVDDIVNLAPVKSKQCLFGTIEWLPIHFLIDELDTLQLQLTLTIY